MTTSNAPVRSSPDPASFVAAVARLRAEQEVASTSQAQALLFHEMGVLEERHGDEAAAARDHLAAVNCDPDFREPLERLIAIVERRQSYKNLGKLLERLVRVAETPTERARALVDEATHFADFENNFDGARSSLQEAAENAPEDVTLWLALERVAARMADPSLSERALTSRAELVQDPTLRGLLLADIAEGRAAQGELDGAFEALDRAIGQGGEATFLAMLAEERIAREHGRADVEAKVLEMQGELVLMAITDAQAGDTYGVPRHKRHPGAVGDAWLRAAELYRRQGDTAKTTTLLERAISELASEPSILHARLCLAEASSDRATAARLARAELEHGMTGEVGASLWLRVAEAAAAEEQIPDALEALGKALSLAPGSIEARALYLDLLAARGEPGQLAAALEATAEQLELDSAKANYYLAAADVWARLAKDVSGAKAALSQAGMFGLSKMLSARAARMLASLLGDTTWYEEATRRLLAQGATEEEQADLWLELVRLRLLRKDTESARHALNSAAQTPSGAFLSRLLAAYALPWTQSGDTPAPVDPGGATLFTELAELEPEPELAQGLKVISARRALERGELARATETLSALQREDGSDLILTGALSAAFAAQDQAAKVRDVFEQAAQNCHDPELAAALHAAAFVLSWKVGERARALSSLQKASDEQPSTFGPLLGSALRAAGADDASARERAHEALASADPALAALERFGLEVGADGSETTAWEALTELRVATDSELGRAGELARALWAPTGGDGASRREALEGLAEHGREAARLAQALLHQLTLSEEGDLPDPSRVLESAERLARADSSAVSALEWLAAAIAAQEHDQEIQARLALAARVTEPLSSAVSSSAALMAELLGTGENASVRSDSPAARLTNLELAVPGQDPGRRAHALAAAAPLIGEDSEPLVLALAGFNQLAAGDIQGAIKSFRSVVDTYPDEVIGWEGLRAAALADGDRATLAEACAALGDAVSDAGLGAKLWEEAASILLDELSDPVRGEFALTRATERDIGLFSAFDRLFRILRARKDAPRLLGLIEQRLTVASDPQEVLRLVWERARALRESGDREGALAALQKVRELEPDHVGALALTGEICITLQRYEEAAEHLARLAAHPSAPQQQRLMSGVAAVDLYESRLKNPNRALEVLTGLYRGGLSTLPVRERLARTATRVGAYDEATEVLEVLMEERETPAGRIEAARLAMVIYRDELG
ncbi:MAG TPA: tetratricopeptide repeat protein, partial [Polyangiaceae bacterium]|nr:tetratricopeptide repeat protein [Polyangiaceae bacterium]